MVLGVWKLDNLVLHRWTVPRSTRLYRATIHRRCRQIVADDLFASVLQKRDPTRLLRQRHRSSVRHFGTAAIVNAQPAVPEMRPLVIELGELALLSLEYRIIDGATIDPRWCPGLEPSDCESCVLELFSEVSR